FVEGGRVGLGVRTATGESAPALDYEALLEEHRLAERAEEHRLLYVGMTRAEERVVVSGAARCESGPGQDPGAAPIAWLAPALVPDLPERLADGEADFVSDALRWDGRAVPVRVLVNRAATVGDVLRVASLAPVPSASDAGGTAPPEPPAPPPAPARTAPVDHLSYSALEEYGRCGHRFYLQRVLRLPPRELPAPDAQPAATVAEAGPAPALLRGSLAHELLERLDLAVPSPVDPAEVQARARAHGADLDAAEA